MYLVGSPTPSKNLPIRVGASTTSLSAFGSVLSTMPASHISPSNCATTSYALSILLATSGAPRKSSKASAILWRNSRTNNGSTSEDDGAMNKRRSWRMLNSNEGGFVSVRYISEGRGLAWARYKGRTVFADGGRPFQTCSTIGLLKFQVSPCKAG